MLTAPDSINAAVNLFDLVAAIASERNRDRVATKCLTAACRLANAEAGVLYAMDSTGSKLVPVACQPEGLTNPVEGGLALYPADKPDMADPRTWTTFSGQPVLLEDLGRVAGFDLAAIHRRDQRGRRRTASLLAFPLRSNDEVTVGVLELLNIRKHDGAPGERGELEALVPLLRAFAYQAAISISNLALLERNRLLVAELNASNRQLESENQRLRQQTVGVASYATGLVAKSAAMQAVLELVGKVADSNVSVLVLGETGTGKEVIARLLHATSGRRAAPFIAQNCAALPAEMLESELFGHRKGAFTGAVADKMGLFAAAGGGVLFLDEIGELPLTLQSKLLRVLQDGEVRPLGATEGQRHDVRVIAATNVDLRGRVAEGRFREDLFYRISVFPIVLPTLRDRIEDIGPLAEYFLMQFARLHGKAVDGLTPEALLVLRRYGFPGNVRELKNVLERAVILARPGVPIGVEELPPELLPERVALMPTAPEGGGVLRNDVQRYEAQAIAQALQSTGGNRTHAARVLGLSRRTLQEKISRYGLGSAEPPLPVRGGGLTAHEEAGRGPS